MKLLISGASGLLGRALTDLAETQAAEIWQLVRHAPRKERQIAWYPERELLDAQELEGFDAVIHLAGETIAGQRWNSEIKNKILSSRVQGTRLLAHTLSQLKTPPATFLSASAIGYYGDRADYSLEESAQAGHGFLAEVCQQWEAYSAAVDAAGIRRVNLRIGIVLSKEGGALKAMLPLFQAGLAGPLGSGKQYMSWIALDDLISAIWHCLHTESLKGPVNLVAPAPVTNQEFTRILAKVICKPAIIPAPAFALKLALGPEMAQGLLLDSARVIPRKLLNSGFNFAYPDLELAFRHQLKTINH